MSDQEQGLAPTIDLDALRADQLAREVEHMRKVVSGHVQDCLNFYEDDEAVAAAFEEYFGKTFLKRVLEDLRPEEPDPEEGDEGAA